MKRFVAVLSSLLVLPAFAEVAPIYYDEIIEYAEDEISDANAAETSPAVVQPVAQPSSVSPRSTVGGRAAARNIPNTNSATGNTRNASTRNVSTRTATASRAATTARTGVAPRTATVTPRATTSRAGATSSRAATSNRLVLRPVRAAATSAATPSVGTTARRAAATTTGGARTARAGSLVQTDTVNTPLYTGRVSTRSSAVMARSPSAGATTGSVTTSVSAEDAITTAEQLEYMESLTTVYKERYQNCMDNYCNKLDDQQNRCTCSKNIKSYAEIENALKVANDEYIDAVIKLSYLELDPSDIEAIFEETGAELAMSGKTDNSDLAADIEAVRKSMREIETPKASSSATYTNTTTTSFFNPSALLNGEGLDGLLGGFNLFGTNTNTADTSSINNQRGEQLYKTASARCKAAVLNEAQSKGVDIAVITNSYDIAIDKDCIAYERLLEEKNEEMKNRVLVAEVALQNARVGISRNKNSNDLRGCINALDSCMQDEFICGADYEYCLDPTGKYIVDGELVVGSTPGYAVKDNTEELESKPIQWKTGLYTTWAYDNKSPWIDGTLTEYINETITDENIGTETNMAKFLQNKIGYIGEDGKSYGMCADHLKTCQAYTFDEDGEEYMPDNRVIKEYLQRTLTKIKVAQDNLLAEHAEECITDVTKCLQNNNYDWTNSQSTKSNIAINACKAQITTCMSVNGAASNEPTPASMREWVYDTQVIFVDQGSLQTQCENSGGKFNTKTYDCSCPTLSEDEGAYCTAIPYAELNSNKKYVCRNGYTQSNGICIAKAGTVKEVTLSGATSDAETIYYHITTGKYHSNEDCTAEITQVDTPNISNGTFAGYYSDGKQYIDETGYIVGVTISADTTLTAKIECNSGYELNTTNNTCIPKTTQEGGIVNPNIPKVEADEIEREDISAGEATMP